MCSASVECLSPPQENPYYFTLIGGIIWNHDSFVGHYNLQVSDRGSKFPGGYKGGKSCVY